MKKKCLLSGLPRFDNVSRLFKINNCARSAFPLIAGQSQKMKMKIKKVIKKKLSKKSYKKVEPLHPL